MGRNVGKFYIVMCIFLLGAVCSAKNSEEDYQTDAHIGERVKLSHVAEQSFDAEEGFHVASVSEPSFVIRMDEDESLPTYNLNSDNFIRIVHLKISPDPVTIGGTAVVSYEVKTNFQLDKPVLILSAEMAGIPLFFNINVCNQVKCPIAAGVSMGSVNIKVPTFAFAGVLKGSVKLAEGDVVSADYDINITIVGNDEVMLEEM